MSRIKARIRFAGYVEEILQNGKFRVVMNDVKEKIPAVIGTFNLSDVIKPDRHLIRENSLIIWVFKGEKDFVKVVRRYKKTAKEIKEDAERLQKFSDWVSSWWRSIENIPSS